MGKYLQRCEELRGDTSRHYGCSQAVFIPFAEQMGLDSETANAISANFRAGMLTGRVCGAVTGALMALGLAGASPKAAMELQSRVQESHGGDIDCKALLDKWHGAGNPNRKPHCDGMCFACVAMVEELLEREGKLK
jgi:hypothetical protein